MNSETFSEVKYSDPKWYGSSKPEDTRIKKVLEMIRSEEHTSELQSR